MTKHEEKYLENKISLVRAVVSGTLAGLFMFRTIKEENMGTAVEKLTDNVMRMVGQDIRNVYKQGKKMGRLQ